MRRSTSARRRARARVEYVARRIGTGLRDARLAQGLRQIDVAKSAGITQPFYSRIERGLELSVALLTLAACAAAVNVQLAAFIEALPGANLPRDIEHMGRQSLLVAIAARGGWHATPEAVLAHDGTRPRSIDVLLTRDETREAAVVEIWDLLVDGGEAMRGLEAKVIAISASLGSGWQVRGLLLLRRTSRNRALVRDLAPLVAARYPASSSAWLRALSLPGAALPSAAGFAWTTVRGDRLVAARLPHRR